MTDTNVEVSPQEESSHRTSTEATARRRLRRRLVTAGICSAVVIAAVGCTAWLADKASTVSAELKSATELIPQLKERIIGADSAAAESTVQDLQLHTARARTATEDPLWTLAGALPWIGANFRATDEVATAADDVAQFGAVPLVSIFRSLDWQSLALGNEGVDLGPLTAAEPKLASAAHAVRQSSERLNNINAEELLPEVSGPLIQARTELGSMSDALDAASSAAGLAPKMMGAENARGYLLLIQNNAEARATGGIPGALAVLTLDNGKLSLGDQTSAAGLGIMTPTLAVESEQQQIYSGRIGKYMQDVNLTPDFPTAASTAQAMWERKTGQRVDGVISIDPVALGYILDATGSVKITSPQLIALASGGLPTELNGKNVVQTLLSDVYAKIEQPKLQDTYFAGVAQEIFASLSDGKSNAKSLIEGITRGTEEGRVLVWSARADEQLVLASYPLSGSIAGPSVSPAQFGVYFNDGTGAKMDYYVKRTVQLVKECAVDGYEQTSVRITSTNTAPANAATSLPAYVTGDGIFGVPPGSVQTNIVAYGPVQANVENAKLDGERTDFAPYFHSNRPVGVHTVRLAPGESKTLEFTFGKIVQHAEPNVVVTPTVQDVKDVILPTENAECAPGL